MTGNGSLQAGGVSSSVPQPMVDSEGRQVFHYEGGLSQYVAWMNEGKTKLHDPIYITR
jgi:DNA gyrase/topoisomerase IV subunit B